MKKSPSDGPRLMSKQAQAQRDKAMAIASRRKEEFIGARVPKELREKLFERAEAEGLPVSLLMRRILEAHLLGGGAGAGGDGAAKGPIGQTIPNFIPPPARRRDDANAARFAHVLGWDNITLNRDVTCTGCGVGLAAGGKATVGFPAAGGVPVILCDACRALA